MKIHLTGLLSLLFSLSVFSQNSISGIINQYVKVTALDECQARLSLTSAAGFNAGDQVLLVQMQGAAIDQTNSGSFGNITDTGSAGFFEKNEIKSITGNDIFLKYNLVNVYNAGGALQLVSMPVFTEAVVTDTLKAALWNGATGGILALEVENTLTLEAPVDVSRAGFRGGVVNVVSSDCTFLTNANDYFYNTSNWRGAPKGEGIAANITGKEHGRGAQANGGGGGNDHNSGGGGGGHANAGGVGGQQTPSSTFGCYGNYPGQGGKALPDLAGRIFMGGGGGAGHVDDAGAGSAGGRGGGIIFIVAGAIAGNTQSILANGGTPPQAGGDGAGGGGAGGTILLDAAAVTGSISIEARGGNGGNVSNSPDRCFGPGGGGSGGKLLTNQAGFASVNLSGGLAGLNTTASGQCNGLSNEALAGGDGQQENVADIPGSLDEIVVPMVIQQPQPATVCEGEPAVFSLETQGNMLTYQWQVNPGSGWVNVVNSPAYTGAQSSELIISNPGVNLDGHEFQCLVSGPCTQQLMSTTVELTVLPAPVAGFSVNSLGNGLFQFDNTSINATTFHWDFGNGDLASEANPLYTYSVPGIFTVTLTAEGDCGMAVFTQLVIVSFGQAPEAGFSSNTPAGCVPLTVQFQNQSTGTDLTGFNWEFEGGIPAVSTEENPVVTYTLPGVYGVKLNVTNSLGESTQEVDDYVMAVAAPLADFSFVVNGNTVSFSNDAAGGTAFLWLFGDGTSSTEENPVHTYPGPGIYNVSLSVSNADCGSAISYQVEVGTTGTGEPDQHPFMLVFPNPAGEEVTMVLSKHHPEALPARLWDEQGHLITHFGLIHRQQKLNLAGLPAGVYLLEAGPYWVRILKK